MRALLLVLGFILLNKIANTQVIKDINENLGKALFGERSVATVKKNNPLVQTASFKPKKLNRP